MPDESNQAQHYTRATRVRWALVVLLSLAAGALAVLLAMPHETATAQVVGGVRSEGVFAVPAQLGPDTHGLFLIDAENDTLCVYEYAPGSGSSAAELRLTAARRYSFDMRLEDYNTQPPPREIRDLVEQHRRMEEASPDD